MRILFTIPHYYDAAGGGMYGSLKPNAARRRDALATAIFGLHATFGRRQGLMATPIVESNTVQPCEIRVVVCTTGDRHLVKELPLPPALLHHHPTNALPRYLGFECHSVLRDHLGQFDYYCFLEDDLLLNDPLFFIKLAWFNRFAGDEAVLQPNRFELAVQQPWHKLYIDGNLSDRSWSERWQDINDRRVLAAEVFGIPIRFQRVNNPHSGCFFLNERQMKFWASQPTFLVRETTFAGPLESAATYGIMRYFRVYKPARENAGFLEIRHLDNRYLGARLSKAATRPRESGAAR